jgi:hypothetical protein
MPSIGKHPEGVLRGSDWHFRHYLRRMSCLAPTRRDRDDGAWAQDHIWEAFFCNLASPSPELTWLLSHPS